MPRAASPRVVGLLATVGLAACGEAEAPVGRAVLGLGEVPGRVASISVAVFDEEGLAVSATVAPPRAEFDLGVPAEVPLLFQVVARTSTPAPGGFAGGLPAFVARAEGVVVPLTRAPVRVGLEARPAGGLRIGVSASPSVPPGALVIRSESGVPGVRRRLRPDRLPAEVLVVLGRGRQRVTYAPDEGPEIDVLGGADLFVAAETISVADLRLEPRRDRPSLALRPLDGEQAPLAPLAGASGPVSMALTLAGREGPVTDPDLPVTLSAVTSGTAQLDGLPRRVSGAPSVLTGLSVSGEGRVVVRASAPGGLGALAVFNAGTRRGEAAGLRLALGNPAGLREGTTLEVWTVDGAGRLTIPPVGTLSLASSDPWLIRPDGDAVEVMAVEEDARIVRRVVLSSRPLGRSVFARARLLTATGTLSASLPLP